MTGLAAGVGAKLAFGGVLKGIGGFIRSIPWYIWLGLALAGLVAFLAISRGHWMERAQTAETQLNVICADVRKAAGNPKLGCKDAPEQIRLLGKAVADLKGAIGRQNAAVTQLGAETKRQQQASAVAQKRAEKRAGLASGTAEGLMASSRSRDRQERPCEASEALQEAWR